MRNIFAHVYLSSRGRFPWLPLLGADLPGCKFGTCVGLWTYIVQIAFPPKSDTHLYDQAIATKIFFLKEKKFFSGVRNKENVFQPGSNTFRKVRISAHSKECLCSKWIIRGDIIPLQTHQSHNGSSSQRPRARFSNVTPSRLLSPCGNARPARRRSPQARTDVGCREGWVIAPPITCATVPRALRCDVGAPMTRDPRENQDVCDERERGPMKLGIR